VRRFLVGLGSLAVLSAVVAVAAEAAYSASSPDPDRLLLIQPAFAAGEDWRGSYHAATVELPAEVGWGNRQGVVVNVTVRRHGWELLTRMSSAGLGAPAGGRNAAGEDVHALSATRLRLAAAAAGDVSGVATSCSSPDRCRRYDFELRYRGTLLRVVAFNSKAAAAEIGQADALRYLHDLDLRIGGAGSSGPEHADGLGGRAQTRFQRWFEPPLQVQMSTGELLAVAWPFTSRHSPDWTPTIVPPLIVHCWFVPPLQS
jgi:hypothetical protein